MDNGDIFSLICLMILILLSAFFSSAETAFMTVSKIRMRALIDEGNSRAKTVLTILDKRDKMLSAVLIGNNIVNLSASSLATTLTIHVAGNRYVGYVTGILTFLILIFGEISPKTLASYRAERLALLYAGVIRILMTILTPAIFFVNICAQFVLLFFHINSADKQNTITEKELRTVLDVSREEGIIEQDEHEIFHNVISFGDARAKDVMVPRIHIVETPVTSTYDELLAIYRDNRYTRLPVYADDPDEIIGIINIKDLLLHENEKDTFTAKDILQAPYFTFENKKTSELLFEMRRDTPVMAIVLDEYGELAGLLTIEDLLEEIVGKINDEDDDEEDREITRIAPREYRVEGSMNLEDFCEELHLSLESEDYDSIGGYMIEQLDRLPQTGDIVTTDDGVRLIVESMDEKRIEHILVYLPSVQKTDAEAQE